MEGKGCSPNVEGALHWCCPDMSFCEPFAVQNIATNERLSGSNGPRLLATSKHCTQLVIITNTCLGTWRWLLIITVLLRTGDTPPPALLWATFIMRVESAFL
jgi:hypothetical protein